MGWEAFGISNSSLKTFDGSYEFSWAHSSHWTRNGPLNGQRLEGIRLSQRNFVSDHQVRAPMSLCVLADYNPAVVGILLWAGCPHICPQALKMYSFARGTVNYQGAASFDLRLHELGKFIQNLLQPKFARSLFVHH